MITVRSGLALLACITTLQSSAATDTASPPGDEHGRCTLQVAQLTPPCRERAETRSEGHRRRVFEARRAAWQSAAATPEQAVARAPGASPSR